MSEEQRRYERVLTELDVALYELDGTLIDERGVADDVSPLGFRVVVRAPLEKDARVAFEMRLVDDYKVKGHAEVVWTDTDRWGANVLGMKIVKMSWGDRARLRGKISRPGYDFVSLAKKAVIALFAIVCAAAVHNIAFHQPAIRATLGGMLPVFAAVIVLSLGLWLIKD